MVSRRKLLSTVAPGMVLSMAAPRIFAEYLHLPPDAQTSTPQWLPITDHHFEIDGLPWFAENGGELSRLPIKLKSSYRAPVWRLAQSPSGGRIRFRTNSTALSIKLEYPKPPNMANMQAFGQTGVDVYVDGSYCNTAIAGKDSAPGLVQEHTFFKDLPREQRDITLYLPLYMPVKVHALGVDANAEFQSPRAFALPKPIVFYGTSITQGAAASRPGMSYEAMVGRLLNVDYVNLGFSGNGIGEPEVAETVASLDAAYFVLDFAHNNPTVESLQKVYAPFIATIRAKHPVTPILLVTPLYDAHDAWSHKDKFEAMRALIRQVAADRIAAGDKNLQMIEGTDLLGRSRASGLTDGTHPNDLGMKWIADGLAARIATVLGIKPDPAGSI